MKRPNIVFLIADQMQSKVLAPGSPCKMPNMQALKRASYSFSETHAVNAICSPCRASLMTGMLPHRHGMVDCVHTVPPFRAEFDRELDTMGNCFQDKGYATAYYGKWHIERTHDLSRYGFDEYETETIIPRRQVTPVKKLVWKTDGYPDRTVCGVYEEDERCSEEYYVYNRAMEFMEQYVASSSPFCTFISTYAPHDPYVVPKSVYDLYQNDEILLPASFYDSMEDKPSVYQRMAGVWDGITEDQAKEIIRCYYSYCTLIDMQVGRLVKYLKEKEVYENTMIIFTSDHGDQMGAHRLFCKGVPAFEETYSIPFFIHMPGMTCGNDCPVLCNTCDIAPTVLELAGCRCLKHEIHGKSLVPYLKGEVSCDTAWTFAEFFGQRYCYTQRIVWKGKIQICVQCV